MPTMESTTGMTPVEPGYYMARTHPAYWNMIGPFGGWGALLAIRGAMTDARADGAFPVSASVQFMGPMEQGDIIVRATALRLNRSTSFWHTTLHQPHDSSPVVAGAVTLAKRRDGFARRNLVRPIYPAPEEMPEVPLRGSAPAFMAGFEVRADTRAWLENEGGRSESLGWYREREETRTTLGTLTALSDIAFPGIFLLTGAGTRISTIALNMQFHIGPDDLEAMGHEFILVQAGWRNAGQGYFDQYANLWDSEGRLLVTSDQMVWFRAGEEAK